MSVYLKGDGRIYSDIKFDAITLPNPAISPDVIEDNIDIIEADAGHTVTYQKGSHRRTFPYRFTLLTNSQKTELWNWWQVIQGRLSWFLLQPYEQQISSIFEQEMISEFIYNAELHNQRNWEGYWIFVLDGDYGGEKRKATNFEISGDYIKPKPYFSGKITTGTNIILGYPVVLENARFEAMPRYPSFWDITLVFKEKMVNEI